MRLSLFSILLMSIVHAQTLPSVINMKTTMGDIKIELDENTPITTNNFYRYVTDGFFNGKIFHRVVKDFVIQAGGFNAPMSYEPATHPTIKNEAQIAKSNLKGTISMARTSDPDSASSQFFINLVDNTNLDFDASNNKAGYAVFGEVISGLDIVEAIGLVPVGDKTFTYNGKEYTFKDVPVVPVIILTAEVE